MRSTCHRGESRRSARRNHYLEQLEERALLAAPSGAEQEMLEWINRLRMDPAGEYGRLISSEAPPSSPIPGVASALSFFRVSLSQLRTELQSLAPVSPLAWSSALNQAAFGHNLAMIAADDQSHQLPGEGDLGTRANASGYAGWTVLGENVYAFAQSIAQAHAAFVIDWGVGPGGMQAGRGHRVNLMSPAFREVGISVTPESNPATQVGPLVLTQDFGSRYFQTDPYLLGVVFSDLDGDRFYDNGEGLGGVNVSAVGPVGTYQTTTFASGGYQLTVPPGSYTVTFSGGALPAPRVRYVVVGGGNTKLDLNTIGSDPASSNVQMQATLVGVTEGSAVEIVVVRGGDTSQAATVRVAPGPGTSASTEDYEPLPNDGVLQFQPGQTRASLLLKTVDDLLVEPTETLVLVLYPGPGMGLGLNGRTTVMITDNDKPPVTPVSVLAAVPVPSRLGVRSIVVQLAGDVDPRSVARPSNFVISRAGVDRALGTRDDIRSAVSRVVYNRVSKLVTLFLATPIRGGETVLLTIRANTIRDTSGQSLPGPLNLWLMVPLLAKKARR